MPDLFNALIEQFTDAKGLIELQAQLDMVLWTKISVIGMFVGTAVNIGILIAAFRSLRASQNALILSERSVEAAQKTGEMQNQAYLNAASVKFGISTNVVVTVRNSGLSPATRFSIRATAKPVASGSVARNIEFPDIELKAWSAIGPDQDLAVSVLQGDDDVRNFIDLPPPKGLLLLICGEIFYTTIYGKEHFTQFAFYFDPAMPKKFRRPTIDQPLQAFADSALRKPTSPTAQ